MKDQERRTHLTDHALAKRLHGETVPRAQTVWIFEVELFRGELQLRIGHGDSHARLETRRCREVVSLIGAIGVKLKGSPDVGWRIAIEIETGTQDPDDDVRLIAERDTLPDRSVISAKAPLPEAMADDGDVRAARPVFFDGECAPLLDGCAEEAEGIGADLRHSDLLGVSAAGQVDDADAIRRNILQHAGLVAPKVEFCRRGAYPGCAGSDEHELHDAIGVRVRERLEQDRVHHRKDRRVRADTQRESGNGGDGERGIQANGAKGITKILEQGFYHGFTFARAYRSKA